MENEDKIGMKMHLDISSDSDNGFDGKEQFDELHNFVKPPPICYDPNLIVKIPPSKPHNVWEERLKQENGSRNETETILPEFTFRNEIIMKKKKKKKKKKLSQQVEVHPKICKTETPRSSEKVTDYNPGNTNVCSKILDLSKTNGNKTEVKAGTSEKSKAKSENVVNKTKDREPSVSSISDKKKPQISVMNPTNCDNSVKNGFVVSNKSTTANLPYTFTYDYNGLLINNEVSSNNCKKKEAVTNTAKSMNIATNPKQQKVSYNTFQGMFEKLPAYNTENKSKVHTGETQAIKLLKGLQTVSRDDLNITNSNNCNIHNGGKQNKLNYEECKIQEPQEEHGDIKKNKCDPIVYPIPTLCNSYVDKLVATGNWTRSTVTILHQVNNNKQIQIKENKIDAEKYSDINSFENKENVDKNFQISLTLQKNKSSDTKNEYNTESTHVPSSKLNENTTNKFQESIWFLRMMNQMLTNPLNFNYDILITWNQIMGTLLVDTKLKLFSDFRVTHQAKLKSNHILKCFGDAADIRIYHSNGKLMIKPAVLNKKSDKYQKKTENKCELLVNENILRLMDAIDENDINKKNSDIPNKVENQSMRYCYTAECMLKINENLPKKPYTETSLHIPPGALKDSTLNNISPKKKKQGKKRGQKKSHQPDPLLNTIDNPSTRSDKGSLNITNKNKNADAKSKYKEDISNEHFTDEYIVTSLNKNDFYPFPVAATPVAELEFETSTITLNINEEPYFLSKANSENIFDNEMDIHCAKDNLEAVLEDVTDSLKDETVASLNSEKYQKNNQMQDDHDSLPDKLVHLLFILMLAQLFKMFIVNGLWLFLFGLLKLCTALLVFLLYINV